MSIVGVVTAVTSAITGAVVSVSVPVLLFLAQEMTVRLKRKRERIIGICLTWFPIGSYRRTQYITSIGLFYKEVGILLGGLSDCVKN